MLPVMLLTKSIVVSSYLYPFRFKLNGNTETLFLINNIDFVEASPLDKLKEAFPSRDLSSSRKFGFKRQISETRDTTRV